MSNPQFKVQMSGQNLQFSTYLMADRKVNGRQLVRAFGKRNTDEFIVLQMLPDGATEEIRLEELVDLENPGVEKFIIGKSSETYRLVLDGLRIEWFEKYVTVRTLIVLAQKDPDDVNLIMELSDQPDAVIENDQVVDLSTKGLERFFTRSIKSRKIIVNGREKITEQRDLSFTDLVNMAFENPPSGENVCFTVTYRNGHPSKPEGSLIEGQSVRVKEGMVFNVTSTDKS